MENKTEPKILEKVFSKNAKINGRWQFVHLTEKEVKSVREEHRKRLLDLMKKCIEDSADLFGHTNTEIAVALFNRQADASYTLIQNALDNKIMMQREKAD